MYCTFMVILYKKLQQHSIKFPIILVSKMWNSTLADNDQMM